MSFIIKKIGQIDLCQQKWPIDPKIGCKSFFSLVYFIEINVNLEKVFEGALERWSYGVINFELNCLTSFHLIN
jgi:hypothetical protein